MNYHCSLPEGLRKRQSVGKSESRKGELGGSHCLRKGIETGGMFQCHRKEAIAKEDSQIVSSLDMSKRDC